MRYFTGFGSGKVLTNKTGEGIEIRKKK